MINIKHLILASMALSWALFAQTKTSDKSSKNLLIVSDKFCPMVCDNKSKPGILVEILERALSPYTVSLKFLSQKRSILEIEENKAQIILGLNKDHKAKNVIVLDGNIFSHSHAYLIHKDENLQSALKKTGASSQKHAGHGEATKNMHTMKMDMKKDMKMDMKKDMKMDMKKDMKMDKMNIKLKDSAKSVELNVKKLLKKRIGYILGDEYVLTYYKNLHPKELQLIKDPTLNKMEYFLGINSSDKKLLEEIKTKLKNYQKTRNDEEIIKNICSKYTDI